MSRSGIVIFIFLLLFCMVFPAAGQEGGKFSLLVTPGLNLVLGKPADMFNLGGGVELSGLYSMPFAPWLAARAAIDYNIVPTVSEEENTNLNLITFSAGGGVNFNFTSWLSVYAFALGGYGLGVYKGESGGSAYFGGEGGVSFLLDPAFGIGAGVGYRHYVSEPDPFYQGLKVHLGAFVRFGAGKRKPKLEIYDTRIKPVFPVFYKHYDEHTIGLVGIRNGENSAIKNVRVSFFAPQYMDKPKVCTTIDLMKRGDEEEVPLYALFTDKVLTITEGTKVAGEIKVSYTCSGKEMEKEISETLRLYDRNAMTWDDDRKASAFITAKDPEVLRFAKGTAGFIREHHNKAINLNFRIGMGLFEGLRIHGINYVVDPQTPYGEFSEDSDAIDYLQFPIHTMTYKAGDCDDLSILYCALLESTGIETAFITIPGHIFAAFNIGMPPEEAKKMFRNPENLIYQNEKTWIPVEITMIQDGFLKAWEKGASQWREHVPAGNAKFYPIHKAWSEYEPVGLPDASAGLELPTTEQIARTYTDSINRFVERDISDTVERYLERIESSNNNPKYINGLGVLYGKYGLLDKAKSRFEQAVRFDYVPAMINLGNVLYLKEKIEDALRYYTMARAKRPDSTQAILGIAKTNYDLEKYSQAKTAYTEIKNSDPELAGRFTYLVSEGSESEQTGRASAAMKKETVLWVEEE
jgi:tetratricopeptide (TPR) repeat protein